ncbi:MAG: DUF2807 domain-containing protein [Hymenobacteraceae bacterium]|nr:DUF2807 domain-containing protein [Hymenobacteraceae bacterium]
MKTSNILLLTALLVLLFSMGAYNMALKSQYASGEYKNPLANFTLLDFTDFDEIDVKSANFISVKVETGDKPEVYLQNTENERIHVSQEGNRLIVEVTPESDGKLSIARTGPYHIIIRTPNVTLVRTDAAYIFDGKINTTPNQLQYANHSGLTVEGLSQDSLKLELDNGSNLVLRANEIGYLQASAGHSPNSEPKLQLLSGNKVKQADITILNRGHLVMQNVAIPQLNYTLSEDAKVELSGASLDLIRK